MTERGGTNFLFIIGLGLIVLGAGIYGLLTVLGVSFAIGEVSQESGVPVYLVLLLPGIVVIGLLASVHKGCCRSSRQQGRRPLFQNGR